MGCAGCFRPLPKENRTIALGAHAIDQHYDMTLGPPRRRLFPQRTVHHREVDQGPSCRLGQGCGTLASARPLVLCDLDSRDQNPEGEAEIW